MSKDIIPSNILAEENVLGSILLEEEQLSRIDLEPADFIEEKHQIIFKAMLDLYKDGGGIDQVTVSHKLHKDGNSERIGSAILSHFIAITPTSLHAVHYAKIIKECSLNRSLISAASKISQIGFGNKDPGESLAESQKLLSGISRSMPSTKIWTPQDMAEEANKRYGKLRDTIPGIPTGLKLFDKMTGGLFNGDYILLGARPSIGKTTLAAQIAIHISDNLHALFVSLEMTKDSVIDKVVAHLIGKPASLIRRGNYNEDLLSDITLSLGEIASKNLYLSCGPTSTKSLRQIIERMKLSYGVDVVFVDYLQYLRDREGNSDNERIGFISGELANMAKEFNDRLGKEFC